MSKHQYVVIETNFECNDEYHTVGGVGGRPVTIFDNEEKAKKYVQKHNSATLKDYGASIISGMIYMLGFDAVFEKTPSFEFDEEDIESTIKGLTKKQLEEMESCLSVKFFTYHKV